MWGSEFPQQLWLLLAALALLEALGLSLQVPCNTEREGPVPQHVMVSSHPLQEPPAPGSLRVGAEWWVGHSKEPLPASQAQGRSRFPGQESPLRLHIRITWEHFKLSHSPQTNEPLVDPCEQGPGVDTQIDPHCPGDFTVSQGWKPPRPSGSEDLRSFSGYWGQLAWPGQA